jgi:hypothetical protein
MGCCESILDILEMNFLQREYSRIPETISIVEQSTRFQDIVVPTESHKPTFYEFDVVKSKKDTSRNDFLCLTYVLNIAYRI